LFRSGGWPENILREVETGRRRKIYAPMKAVGRLGLERKLRVELPEACLRRDSRTTYDVGNSKLPLILFYNKIYTHQKLQGS
jgi:hypothetical protein